MTSTKLEIQESERTDFRLFYVPSIERGETPLILGELDTSRNPISEGVEIADGTINIDDWIVYFKFTVLEGDPRLIIRGGYLGENDLVGYQRIPFEGSLSAEIVYGGFMSWFGGLGSSPRTERLLPYYVKEFLIQMFTPSAQPQIEGLPPTLSS